MVIVNIRVPALEKEYNFSLDEHAPTQDIVVEVAGLICRKEAIPFSDSLNGLTLYSWDYGFQLSKTASLNDYGLYGGTELILV